jgi:DNA mismatch repair protein MutS2
VNEAIDNRHGFDPDLFAETLAPIRSDEWAVDVRPKTLSDLSWIRLRELISDYAQSPEGLELVDSLRPLPERSLAERRLAEVAEWMQLLDDEADPPVYGLSDIRKAVDYATREGVLVAEDLEAIRRNCDVVARVSRFFKHRDEKAPLLAGVAELLDPCDDLREALGRAIEPGGRLSDDASPDLRRLRRSVKNHTERLKSSVDRLLKSDRFDTVLQDEYFTMREDRYVLPIRVGAKGSVDGIVHGYSSSGRTAYIEPSELIRLNNELRWAQIDVAEEENRILTRLSGMVARHADKLRRNTEVIAYLDLIGAIARFGDSYEGTIPSFSDDRSLELHACFHPLLFLKFEDEKRAEEENPTVSNDLLLDGERRVLVVSGPNTGGKTVLLKALGLATLMAKCGIPIAADENSSLPFYETLFTDIGDEQSIERDLSTFSGHLTNISDFLDECDDGTLVLLDELFTGTDPLQGAALAVSLLEELARKGATTMVTTHLEGLKTLALQSELFANAAMGFDIETLEPTYHVTLGIPGSSFALRIADRLGFPQKLVERAREVLEGEGHLGVDEALTKLDEQVTRLRKEQNRLEKARSDAEHAKRKYQEKHKRLVEKDREALRTETRHLRDRLREVREVAKKRLKEIKKDETITRQDVEAIRDELRESAEEVEEVREKVSKPEPTPEGLVPVDPDDLTPGMTVYAAPYRRNADLLEVHEDEAIIQVGPMKANVDLDEVYYPTEEARRQHMRGSSRRQKPNDEKKREKPTAVPQTDRNTVDLRGLRVNEALEKLDLFLDSAYLQKMGGVYIIHGHGTGALKRAVRGYLPESDYVHDFRPGERGEGGDGVTVAYLG